MLGFIVDVGLFATDQAAQSAKMIYGFAVDRVQNVHGSVVDRAMDIHWFVVDRAREILGMIEHAAKTVKSSTVQSAKMVHGFAQDRTQEVHGFAQNIHGFAVDRAETMLGMVEHAAETARLYTIESVKGVHDFAQAILEVCDLATKTAKQWMARVVTPSKHYWKANPSEKYPHHAHPQEKDLYVGFSGAALMAMAMPSEDMERIMHRSSNKVFFAKDIGTYSDGKEVQELSPKG